MPSNSTLVPPTSQDRGTLIARIRALTPSMSPAQAAIANVVLSSPGDVVRMTVGDLATVSQSSVGSVVRFCQDLGLKGFHEFKLQLASEAPTDAGERDLVQDGKPGSIIASVFQSTSRSIAAAESSIDPEEFERAVHALNSARRIVLVATGPSAPLAMDTALRFRSVGLPIEHPTDPISQHIAASMLTDADVCLAISHTGRTRETVAVAEAARDAGATVVAVTSFYRSPLVAASSVALVAGSGETRFQIEAMTSRFIHLAVLDALYSAVTAGNAERTLRAAALSARAEETHRI
ncbi:MurR/RpiR family transcriptional regulator [Arthrobacter sp. M4]|uniref:MurR/RpiR family transcriptional regulator n=1 Tax=Arthrobacter sp. M4 TaxID=218160 RepID=UPI001CDB7AA9|nr:MurR/RpiR family transcriptional regulator [Arthrobacter sp. M4]MCA4132568.1 MurR/RpiR family transcriptional regulator [Arthrobacter sp. M4]